MAKTRQPRTWSPRMYVRPPPPKKIPRTWTPFFDKVQNDSPFTFGRLIGLYGGIFCATIFPAITGYVLSVYMNIIVCCMFLPRLQPFATTNLAHLTWRSSLPCSCHVWAVHARLDPASWQRVLKIRFQILVNWIRICTNEFHGLWIH